MTAEIAPDPSPAPDAIPAVVVRFTDALRPEAATTVHLAAFEGPLGLLLTLIEARELDIATVPLGDLAGAYLEALADLPADRLANLTAFVAVAAQLILIKSRSLLPGPPPSPPAATDEAPDPEAELRRRLVEYRIFREAANRLATRLGDGPGLFPREASAAAAAGLAGARPPDGPPLDPTVLAAALGNLAAIAVPPPLPAGVVPRTITLRERADAIHEALRHAPGLVLQDLLAGTRDKVLAAVTFLALLELMKRREVVAEQSEPWGPIRVRRTTETERHAGVGAPASDEPIDERLADFA